jgi:thiamine-phosphate pyrophosphorylase
MPAEGVRLLGRLHVITDNRYDRDPRVTVKVALDAGADVIQVRVKGWTDRCLLELAEEIVGWCVPYGAACIVNDRVDVALASGAAGVHLGADDLPVAAARRVLGPNSVVGGTARDAATARTLVAAGASYLGVGPCFATVTKSGLPDPIGLVGVAAVASAVDVPVIAIGGVRVDYVDELRAVGAYGVAVVDAVSGADDPALAVRDLRRAVMARP